MDPRLLILLPLVVSFVVARKSIEKAVLNVYLPILLLFPLYDILKLPNMPFLTFSDTAILPIGIFLIAKKKREWRFTRMDVWMVLFGISSCATLFLHVSNPSAGLFGLFSFLTNAFFPYAIGKLFIEQSDLRIKVMKRIAFLLAVIAIVSMYEYRIGVNPFHDFWNTLIPPVGEVSRGDHSVFEQYRWGFTRASGPYSGSETTGMVYIIGTLLAYCLYKNDLWERKFRFRYHPFSKGLIILTLVAIGLFVSQARGPYFAFLLGYAIARIFTARNLKRASILTVVFLTFVAVPSYKALSSYASADNNGADGDQGNAVYRTIMFQNYIPVMEAGGLFGWVQFPVIDGQTSIDNAYLYFGLTQGYLGAVSFTLMIIDSFISVFLYLRRFTQKQDIAFVFCLGGSILGIAFCIGTVFLTSPVSELIFLMVGWTQSLRTSEPISETLAPAVRARHSFRRVFT